jgi:hypothetical protein
MSLQLNGDTGVTFNDASLQGAAASPYTLKNKLINGDFRIDQRNAGASVTPTNAQYTLDRWQSVAGAASKYSIQQNAGSVTPPAGFKNYLGVTSLSAYSVGASEIFGIFQPIEGFNTADLGFGASGASTVTLSFWVRSSLTGTFGGSLSNGAVNRSYPFTYTISVANTWEYKTVTIAGDTTGTWVGATNGVGLNVQFSLGTGTSLSGTAGAWAGSFYGSATGATSVVGTNGATFYITGVQLEQNTSATPFERRLYNQELANCQRYYYEFDVSGLSAIPCWSQAANITNCRMMVPVTMRTTLTASYAGTIGDNTQDWSVYNNGGWTVVNNIELSGATNQSFRVEITVNTGISGTNAAGFYALNTDGGAKLRASAEL